MSIRVGIIDADLISRNRHRFPNLACMKISGYHKGKGDKVTLITEYIEDGTDSDYLKYYNMYDKIYVSKVFVDTTVPYKLLNLSITEYGGTGFFYANAPSLPPEIEHHKPDYNLYNNWIVKKRMEGKVSDTEFIYYEKYSIGFTTRYCNRHCKFCINQHHNKVKYNSPVKEFLEKTLIRNRICLLDDNILAYNNWEKVFKELNATGLPFEFKQGLDIRALTKEKAEVINNSNIYRNNIYFAFDDIEDKDIVIEKLKLWRSIYNKNTQMYVLCGFDKDNKYNEEFWDNNIKSTLERIKICIEFGIFPYIMRFRKYNSAPSPYRGMYINLAAWCNQRNLFSRMSLNQWADELQKSNEKQLDKKRLYSTKRYLMEYSGKYPEVAYEYFDMKFNKDNKYEYVKEISDIMIRRNHDVKKSKQIIYSRSILNDVFIPKRITKHKLFFKSLILNYENLNTLYQFGLKNPISAFIINLHAKKFLKTDEVMLNTILDIMQDRGEVYVIASKRQYYQQILQALQLYSRHLILIEKLYSKYNSHIFIRYKFIKNKKSLSKNEENTPKYFNSISSTLVQDFLNVVCKYINIKYKSQNVPIVGFKVGIGPLKNISEYFKMNIVNFEFKNRQFGSVNFRKYFGSKYGKYKTSLQLNETQSQIVDK